MRAIHAAATALAFLAAPATAHALAQWSGTASVSATIASVAYVDDGTDASLMLQLDPFDDDAGYDEGVHGSGAGSGTSGHDDAGAFAASASGSGSSSAPLGIHFGNAYAYWDFDIINLDLTRAIQVTIDWVITAEGEASITDEAGEYNEAFVYAYGLVYADSEPYAGCTCDLDLAQFAILREAESDAALGPFGPTAFSDSGTSAFVLDADDWLTFYVGADVYGAAITGDVPLPAAAPLLIAGFGALGLVARRRRAA